MKTFKEILLETIPKDCWWEDMENLTNTPVHYVDTAAKAYAEQFIDAAAQYGDLLFEQNQTRIRGKDKASKYAQECVASWIVGYKSKIIKLKEHLK